MAYYEDLGFITNKIVQKIASGNQRLLRYIAYDSYEPEESESDNGSLQPDVNGYELIYSPKTKNGSRINPVFKLPDKENTARTFVNINVVDIRPNSTSNRYRDVYVNIDIIFHIDVQLVKGNMRHYIIANEIDEIFNGQFIDGLSIGDIVSDGMKVTKASDEFFVATLRYKLLNTSNIGCGDIE